MAEADPDSSDTSELVSLKHIRAPLFSIPGFFVGFGAKGTQETDAGKSPTSSLDFGVFANFGGLFSPRSPAPALSSPRVGQRNKWGVEKVGLSLLNEGRGDSFKRDNNNIVLAPQIKFNVYKTPKLSTDLFDPSVKSSSLPKNYAAPSLCDAVNIQPQLFDSITDAREEHNSPRRSSSSPVDIISTQVYSRSLSAREMALSEDYTCIISHGPNPKTTHIFGDCILDCDPKELGGLGTEDETGKSKEESISNLCLCTGTPQDCQNIHIDSDVPAEKESESVSVEDSLDISPGSSYHEDMFPLGMPLLNP